MPNLSAPKNSAPSALRTSHDAPKPRLRQRVLPFSEAYENLKTSTNGLVTCVAFHSFGKCRKEIALLDSDILARLDQLNMADVQTPIKLMPLMLCSSHWEKTIYHNALFLDWLSIYGSKHDTKHYENIVVDYQSAVAIDIEEHLVSRAPTVSNSTGDPQGGPANNLARGMLIQVPAEVTLWEIVGLVVTFSALLEITNFSLEHSPIGTLDATDHPQRPSSSDNSAPLELWHNLPSKNMPSSSVLISMEAFASIEFGVAKLEIMYQDSLRCIAMTSDGWRCHEILSQGQMFKARELLLSSVTSRVEFDIEFLPRIVLCPGHARCDLPRIYAERWTTFAEQRLPKDEAMRKFNAEFWMSIEFFSNESRGDHSLLTNSERGTLAEGRSRLASNLFDRELEKDDFVGNEGIERDSLRPTFKVPLNYRSGFDFSRPTLSNSESMTTSKNPIVLESWSVCSEHLTSNGCF